MKTKGIIRLGISLAVFVAVCSGFLLFTRELNNGVRVDTEQPDAKVDRYAGSVSCRECHERFYELWAPSHHGLAMQPYTAEFAKANLTPQAEEIRVGKYGYRAWVGPKEGFVQEQGPDGETRYPIEHVMGGKNVYYFLAPTVRGRLQTLPVAYDVRAKEWFDTAGSGVRHFPGSAADEPVHWTDSLYTFNTACYNCHVSQLRTNYDLKTDTYSTEWAEPGINCETCHGPGDEHNRVCRETPEGQVPEDLKIIRTKPFTPEQTNSMCASCHAKMSPVSPAFQPGDRYFDHFDLITLEDPDFYPDGRDLGENYTYTSWLMSPCVKSGKLDCMHCHTSSGRYRFNDAATANNACLPCHDERVERATEHTHHPVGSDGGRCISCHMPMTEFARMRRSDHSMRPPTPAATVAFESPNACNICHTDRDAVWADDQVREWHKDDYQKPVLELASLLDATRKDDWSRLDDVLEYVRREDRDEVIAASLVRLTRSCESGKKWPAITRILNDDPSPLVRAAAAEALDGYLARESLEALLKGARDEYRLVRVRAAASLSGIPPDMLDEPDKTALARATDEFKAAMKARPDDYLSHFNLANFYVDRREYARAVTSFETAIRLRPDFLPQYVNLATAYNLQGQNAKAEQSLRTALKIDPSSEAANLNLGMLLGEMGRASEAEEAFRTALKTNPESAVAAYNLSVIVAEEDIEGAIEWCRKARDLRPEEPKYGYTLAFYLQKKGDVDGAILMLEQLVRQQAAYPDAYALLGHIYETQDKINEAVEVYKKAAENENLSERDRYGFMRRVQALSTR
jgi:tetratricopeptide (TPR) repeat protein